MLRQKEKEINNCWINYGKISQLLETTLWKKTSAPSSQVKSIHLNSQNSPLHKEIVQIGDEETSIKKLSYQIKTKCPLTIAVRLLNNLEK